jgi:hypothetical protein
MKNISKTILTSIVLSGLFLIPVLSSAQNSGNMVNDNIDKSQAESEAVEEMLILDSRSGFQASHQQSRQQIKSRIFAYSANAIDNIDSQAEAEAAVELRCIQIMSKIQKLSTINPVQVNNDQFSQISNLMAANYGEDIIPLQNIR